MEAAQFRRMARRHFARRAGIALNWAMAYVEAQVVRADDVESPFADLRLIACLLERNQEFVGHHPRVDLDGSGINVDVDFRVRVDRNDGPGERLRIAMTGHLVDHELQMIEFHPRLLASKMISPCVPPGL